MTEIMPFPENNIILFYWTAPQAVSFECVKKALASPFGAAPAGAFRSATAEGGS